MFDGNDLLEIIKKAAVEAVDAKKPSGLLFGKVISDSPLKVLVEQKMTLTMEQLVLCRNVTDFKVMMTVKHFTEDKGGGTGDSSYETHKHEYKGKKEFLVHNKLKTGDEVLLLRQQGGQKFIIVDRVVKA
ncbi:MAG: DUF2577 domain-containing protein [Peptostreptococcaceae bacterium]|nr:DUF2577 domain-containing protein [Peptostreptococcaceae bacterium]